MTDDYDMNDPTYRARSELCMMLSDECEFLKLRIKMAEMEIKRDQQKLQTCSDNLVRAIIKQGEFRNGEKS